MEILSQEQEQNQVREPIAEQYAEMVRSQDNFYWSQMLKHLTGKPADHPMRYWRMRSAGFKSVAPPPERSDGHCWDQESCKERCASNTPILVDCMENDKRRAIVARPWRLKNAVEFVREKAAQEDVLVLHLIRNTIGDLQPVTKPAYSRLNKPYR